MPNDNQYYYDLAQVRAQQRLQAEADLAQQELESKEQAKMGWGIFLIAGFLSLVADAAELLTLGTLGWFVGFIIDLILLAMLGISKAGRKQWQKWIWGPLIETIPILAAIPFFRVGFLIWAFVSSRSKTLQGISNIVSSGQNNK